MLLKFTTFSKFRGDLHILSVKKIQENVVYLITINNNELRAWSNDGSNYFLVHK